MVWRLVLEQVASLEEIERTWNLDDLMRANAFLDMRQDMERMQAERDRKHR